MRSSVKLHLGVALALSASAFASKKDGDGKDAKQAKSSAGKQAAAQVAKKTPADGAPAAAKKKLSLPLVEGMPSIGLKIPYRDEDGKLEMMFTIGVAVPIDKDHVKMTELQVETYGQDAAPEMQVNMPDSVFNLNDRVLTSHARATVKRQDFAISGDSVEFNTDTKQGRFVGNVQMLIYNTKGLTDGESNDSATVQPETPKAGDESNSNPKLHE